MKLLSTKRRKRFAIAAACIILLAGIEVVFLPVLVRKFVVKELTSFLGRPVTIQKLDLNLPAMSFTVHGMSVGAPGGGDIFSADTLYVDFQLLSSIAHGIFTFKEASIFGPRFKVVRNANGTLNFADLLLLPWPKLIQFRVDLMQMVDGTVEYTDLGLSSPFSTTITHLTAKVKDFSTNPEQKNSFAVSAESEANEKFSVSGFFRLDPLSSRGVVAVENITLKKYSPYIKELFYSTVADGTLTVRGSYDLDLAVGRGRALLHDGVVAIRSLEVLEPGSGAPLFGLTDLAVTGAEVDVVRQTVDIASIVMSGGTAALNRLSDGSFNVQHVLKPARTQSVKPARAPSVMPASIPSGWSVHVGEIRVSDFAAAVSNVFGREPLDWKELRVFGPTFRTNPFAASVGSITLRDGMLAFRDPSLQPTVRMALTDVNVEIGGFSSDNPQPAGVAVHARIESAAPLQISGDANPIGQSGTANIRGLLQNADLLPLSPYAAKYLGYELASGDLSVDTTMVMRNNRLETQNRIEIDRLTLGARTESKDATKLPVRLAIALLKDLNGKIILNVPIGIALDNPAFDPQKAIIDAVLHPFRKAAEFPFAAFGAQLGGGGDELGFQKFSAGSSDLLPLETGKLDTILKGLVRWPQLMLDVEGSIDGGQDTGDLQLLAASRAAIVQDYLSRTGSMAPGRVFLIVHSLQTVPRKGSRAFLSLKDVSGGQGVN